MGEKVNRPGLYELVPKIISQGWKSQNWFVKPRYSCCCIVIIRTYKSTSGRLFSTVKTVAFAFIIIASISQATEINAGERHAELDQSYYNPETDLLVLHYDMLHDADDIQAVVAAKMMLRYYGIDAIVAGGTKSHAQTVWNPENDDTGQPSATTVLNIAFPGGECSRPNAPGACGLALKKGWVNAGDHWNLNEEAPVVGEVAAIWKKTLDAGGKVYIAEGGMGDFTVDVAKWLIKHGINKTVLKDNVISVQHSNWNMEQSGHGTKNGSNSIYGDKEKWQREPAPNYDQGSHFVDDGNGLLQSLITHWRINDGNGPYGNHSTENTAKAAEFWKHALNGPYRKEWQAAQFWGNKKGRVDFSDTVELVYIFGVHNDIETFDPDQSSWVNFIKKFNRQGTSAAPWIDIWGSANSPVLVKGSTTTKSGELKLTASALRVWFKNDAGPIEVFEVSAYNGNDTVGLKIVSAAGWSDVNKLNDGLTADEAGSTDRASHSGKGFQSVVFQLNDGPGKISHISINHDDAGTWHTDEVYVQYR